MKNVGLFASISLVSLSLAACSVATVTGPGTEQDKGLEGEGVSTPPAGKETNPDGKAYPTTRIGTKASTHKKTLPGTPGDVMKNFKFYGYPKGDRAQGLQQVSLADYYLSLIHI